MHKKYDENDKTRIILSGFENKCEKQNRFESQIAEYQGRSSLWSTYVDCGGWSDSAKIMSAHSRKLTGSNFDFYISSEIR